MKRMVQLFILILITGNLFAQDEYINAVWYNVYQIKLSDEREAKGQIDEHFRMFAELKINKVFFLVKHPNGRSYYKSSIVKPILVNDPLTNKIESIKWDVLEYMIAKGKENNIKIIPYVNIFAEEGYYLEENIEFSEYRRDGKITRWVSPVIPAVQERILNILKEIITKYDVEGIQFDRVRYEDTGTGYNKKSIELFRTIYGREPESDKDKEFIKFRKDNVTNFVAKAYRELKNIKPEIEVSAAVFHSPTTANEVLQDWVKWIEIGAVDTIYTMTYTNDNVRFKKYLDENIEVIRKMKGNTKLVIGMGPYYKNMTPEILIKQLEMCFEKKELSGVCWFSAYNLIEEKFYNVMTQIDYENKKAKKE